MCGHQDRVLSSETVGLDGLPDQRDAHVVGSDAPELGDDLALVATAFYLNSRATSIYAGTNEVQRDLVARTLVPRATGAKK